MSWNYIEEDEFEVRRIYLLHVCLYEGMVIAHWDMAFNSFVPATFPQYHDNVGCLVARPKKKEISIYMFIYRIKFVLHILILLKY